MGLLVVLLALGWWFLAVLCLVLLAVRVGVLRWMCLPWLCAATLWVIGGAAWMVERWSGGCMHGRHMTGPNGVVGTNSDIRRLMLSVYDDVEFLRGS
ncbi:MAG: hypothetical protein ACK4M3_03355 [Pyrobaculum sp.]